MSSRQAGVVHSSPVADLCPICHLMPPRLTPFEALHDVSGVAAVYIYGSWAARHEGQTGQRPVGDIDVLVLGEPDREQLYAALSAAEERLARPVQATIRNRAWLESGSGAFHDTVTSRPMLKLSVPDD
jgi:predicted nucleotidyltransferase